MLYKGGFLAGLEAPWHSYQKKLNALFETDDEVSVGDIVEDNGSYKIDVWVNTHEKCSALRTILNEHVCFGGIQLAICIHDNEAGESIEDVFEKAFKGNRAVRDVKTVDTMGFKRIYVRCNPDIIQFPDDDLGDYNGNYTGLIADVAKSVFDMDGFAGNAVSFCTVDLKEN